MSTAADNAPYIIAGWAAVAGGIGAYVAVLVRRGRALSAQVPADRRRWSTTPAEGSVR